MTNDVKNIIKFPQKCFAVLKTHEFDVEIAEFVAKSMMKVVFAAGVTVSIGAIVFLFKNADALRYQTRQNTPTLIEVRQRELEEERRQRAIDEWINDEKN